MRDILQFWNADTVKKEKNPDSPIDTAKVEETQRHKTRHVGASKPAFRERLSSILTRWHCQKGKPETWNETCWSIKASISCEMSSKFDTLTRSKRKVLHVALFIWIWQRLNQKKSQKCPGGDGGPHFGDPNLTLGSQTSTESGTYQTCSHMFPLHYRGTQPHVSCCTFVIIKPCSLYKVENLSWAYMRAEWVLGINQGPRNTRGLLWKNLGLSQKP